MKRVYLTIGFAAAAIAACIVCVAQVAQQPPKTLPSIKSLMSHEEFTNAGLSKLNEDEIRALDAWVRKFAITLVKANSSAGAIDRTSDAVETYIDGDFEGWEGETIWKLDNGQIWQQASYAYYYHYAFHPKVLIYRSEGGWKMKVDGVDEEVLVKRIK